MTTATIAKADTHQQNASQDYAVLKEEAERLARRIMEALNDDSQPANVNWGDVGSMAHWRTGLREVSDSLFGEGEYAE
jgi:hypothetical protein